MIGVAGESYPLADFSVLIRSVPIWITSGSPTIRELSRGSSNLTPSAATSADSPLYLQVSGAFPWGYNGARMALTSGTKLGPYEIQSPLGTGGMGEVYRARDTRLDRTVAVKILPAHLSSNPEAKQRFEREARAISSLNHPHICTLYDSRICAATAGEKSRPAGNGAGHEQTVGETRYGWWNSAKIPKEA
jgi:serine/threonine protein kinase